MAPAWAAADDGPPGPLPGPLKAGGETAVAAGEGGMDDGPFAGAAVGAAPAMERLPWAAAAAGFWTGAGAMRGVSPFSAA